MLSKASKVYIIMLGTFGIGLWTIITLGSILLHAPTDLSGSWQLHSPETDQEMIIQQSGLFFDIKIDGKHYSLTRTDSQTNPITLTGANLQLSFQQQAAGNYTLHSSGALQGDWSAIRPANKLTTSHARP